MVVSILPVNPFISVTSAAIIMSEILIYGWRDLVLCFVFLNRNEENLMYEYLSLLSVQ